MARKKRPITSRSPSRPEFKLVEFPTGYGQKTVVEMGIVSVLGKPMLWLSAEQHVRQPNGDWLMTGLVPVKTVPPLSDLLPYFGWPGMRSWDVPKVQALLSKFDT